MIGCMAVAGPTFWTVKAEMITLKGTPVTMQLMLAMALTPCSEVLETTC